MNDTARTRNIIALTGLTLGTTTGAVFALTNYVHREIQRRGYPSWDTCQCDFKMQSTIFQVWYSRNEQRGETIVSQEWGLYLVNPTRWFRRFLHHSAQTIATLNPRKRYVERVTLSPQEAYLFAAMLHATATTEDSEEPIPEQSYLVWRREILHYPRHLFDACLRRLYPAHLAAERLAHAEPLPALWDPQSNLPLPTEGTLLDTPIGTHIDRIGWSPTQISYCTAHIKPSPPPLLSTK